MEGGGVTYAQRTVVAPEKSRAEIESLLRKYGAIDFASGTYDSGGRAIIGFKCQNRLLRFELRLPKQDEKRFVLIPGSSYRHRTALSALKAWDQEIRRLWRSMALVIKAKLEAVQSGITTFEHEFMAHIVMPDGKTVGEHVGPRIEEAYSTGRMPALLPASVE
jgi:hypothetical protein